MSALCAQRTGDTRQTAPTAHPIHSAMAYGCQDYQQDFPPVSFSTFKPLPQYKEELPSLSTSDTTFRHVEEPKIEAHMDKDKQESSKIAPHKDIMVKTRVKLKEQTYQWFERTQRKKLVKMGQFPEWFHGFLTRNRTEDMLQDKPLGCFLVRFCESRVGFVLSYRSVERCRHFLLNQRDDEQYVIEGEDSAHPQLEDLINYYCTHPMEPYKELLATPCAKNLRKPDSPSVLRSSPSSPTCNLMYGRIAKPGRETLDAVPASGTSPKDKTKPVMNGKFQAELQSCLQGQKNPAFPEPDVTPSQEDKEDPIVDYTPFSKPSESHEEHEDEEGTPRCPTYASVDELHIYTETTQWGSSAGSNSDRGHEPIAFYAIGRGSCRGNLENVYSEVELNSMASCGSKASRNIQSGFSTLSPASTTTTSKAPKPSAFHSSFRANKTSDLPQEHDPVAQGNPAKPGSKLKQIPLQFDDPAYGRNSLHHISPSQPPLPPEEQENIYERIPEDYPFKVKNVRQPKKAS